MKKKIFSALTLLLVLSTIIVSCSKSGYGSNNTATTYTVSIVNMAFTPDTLTVPMGTTVTWNNNDNIAHTVTADDNSFDSGNIAGGGKFTKMFATTGTYSYHCTIHTNMKATIMVK